VRIRRFQMSMFMHFMARDGDYLHRIVQQAEGTYVQLMFKTSFAYMLS
jgi:hypothetical protein